MHVTFFESLLLLLLAAILLMQMSRRTTIPYPSMLALAGIGAGFLPGTPNIAFDPETMLALFVAPALLDAAFDFPIAAIRRLWRPLVSLAVVLVLLTVAWVAWLGWMFAALPVAAAIALGAIVAPPDAAAANATLRAASLPRRAMEVLKGESLLNDGTALLIFACAVAIQVNKGFTPEIGIRFALAVPGGILLGIVCARIYLRFAPLVRGTLGGSLLEFVNTFLIWIVAERLQLSAVLCVVAFAMTIARHATISQTARARVHSYPVWETVVFLLNVLAFLLMGMQARNILAEMEPERLRQALIFAGMVIASVIVLRIAWVFMNGALVRCWSWLRGDSPVAGPKQLLLVGWCGMRGLVTLATAFALPADFPQRDFIVLAAFGVVIATVVVQGMTIAPLIRLLKIDDQQAQQSELEHTRRDLAKTALAELDKLPEASGSGIRQIFEIDRDAWSDGGRSAALTSRRRIMRAALAAQRAELDRLHGQNEIGEETYLILQQELDWRELSLSTADEQSIQEI